MELSRSANTMEDELSRDEDAVRDLIRRAESDRQRWQEQYNEAQEAWRKAKDEEDSLGHKIGQFFEVSTRNYTCGTGWLTPMPFRILETS